MEFEMSEFFQMLNLEVQKEKNKIDFSPLTKQLKKYWDKIFTRRDSTDRKIEKQTIHPKFAWKY